MTSLSDIYDARFKFSGKIDKLTFKLGAEAMQPPKQPEPSRCRAQL